MKKLILLFLTIMALQVQAQWYDYYPMFNDSWQQLRRIGYLVEKPTDFSPQKKYPLIIFVHGNGGKGPGTKESLENLVLGMKKTATGNERWEPTLIPDLQAAVNKYQILVAAPNYSTSSFSCASTIELLDSVCKLYPVDTKRVILTGFSMGGGTVLECMLNALMTPRLAAAIPIAPVGKSGDWSTVVSTDLPVWGVVNSGDNQSAGATDTNKIKAAIKGINALKPRVPAVLTIFNAGGHGGTEKILSQTPPTAPGGWYFTNATGNIYEWLLSMDSDNPKLPPGYGGSQIPTNPPPVVQPPTTGLTAVAKEIGVTATADIKLDGTASTGWSGASWGTISVPAGVNIYSKIITGGAGWITGTATLPKEGAYTFVLNTYTSTQSAKDTIVVTYQKTTVPVPVLPLTYDGVTGYLVFSDGSRVKATVSVDWATKKVIVKDESGITYAL